MPDAFVGDALPAQARKLFAVTPNDDTDFLDSGVVPKALYVGGDGNVAIRAVDDASAVTLVAVAAGSILPIRPRRVLATGTTATNIVALA